MYMHCLVVYLMMTNYCMVVNHLKFSADISIPKCLVMFCNVTTALCNISFHVV